MSKQQEIMDILQEECGELIVAISKIRRFGLFNNYKDGGSQQEHLTQEIGDVMLMIQLLVEHHVVNEEDIKKASQRKADKLKIWSKIYE